MLAAQRQAENSNARVLVLEEASCRDALGAIIERAGLPWIRAATQDEALSILGRRAVGVVLAHCERDARCTTSLVQEMRRQAPLVPVVLCGSVDDPATVVAALRGGAVDFVGETVDPDHLTRLLGAYLQGRESAPVSQSAASRHSFELASRVARTDVSVLITGESGTGKEVVARFIHDRSDRAAGPFMGVNCAAIPEQMMEATLFGHEKGSFTGAHQSRTGKFEACEGGTLLLDEISEMSLELQAKLLRVLQEREVERIGAHQSRPVNVRVLATSNRDLKEAVREGRFREDLYYRLSVFPLQLEPLRNRVEDILPLAEWFLAKHGARMSRPGLTLSAASRELLVAHAWTGNVRELENAIQRALVLAEDMVVAPEHLGLEAAPALAAENGLESRVRDAEETVIQQTLASCNGRRKDAARALGISERTLRYKLQRLREREELVQ
jgi:two-component system response regulator FlrC